MARYQLRPYNHVFDVDTGHVFDRMEHDRWAAYLAWVAAGNTPDPLPADDPLPQAEARARAEIAERVAMRASLKADPTVEFLRTHTPAECEAWVEENVTNLTTAKAVLAKVAMVVAYLARERLAK